MENTKYDDKFYRLPKRLFKEDQFRSMTNDAKENAAFERCVDVVTSLIFKYGAALKRKWILCDWIKNIQADCFGKNLACKRYQRYFERMKAIVKDDAT